jgi:predicted NBD/HSP70 family sugar kinase
MSKTIRRSHDLRSENRRRVVESLRRIGPCSRVDLGEATELSPGAISSFASDLLNEGVATATRKSVGRGRPQSVLALCPSAATMITVSLSIDRLDLLLIDYAGDVLDQHQRDLDTRALDEHGFIDAVLSAVDTLAQSPNATNLLQISIGVQGITSHPEGELVWSPILSITNVPLQNAVRQRFGISTTVDNDSRLIASALQASECGTLGSNFATVIFSHGIGLALILDEKPFSGISTSALEFGHMRHELNGELCRCGQRGCIEAYASDYAIVRYLERHDSEFGQARSDDKNMPAGRLAPGVLSLAAERAAKGDKQAKAAFAAAGNAIGCGLRDLSLLFGRMPVALVGRNAGALEAMRPQLLAALETAGPQSMDPGKVVLSEFSDVDDLLLQGLILNALTEADRQLAHTITS